MNNSIYKKGLAVVLIIVIIIMAVLGIKLSGKEKEVFFADYSNTNEENEEPKETERYIFVDIDGAVVSPGVYKLIEGSRAIDAINLAGGLKEKEFTQNF